MLPQSFTRITSYNVCYTKLLRGKVIKCDLCGGDPQCAEACPTGAITYVDANWTGYERMKKWAVMTNAEASAS